MCHQPGTGTSMDADDAAAMESSSTEEVSGRPSVTHDGSCEFVAHALAQRHRIDLILANAQLQRRWLPFPSRRRPTELRAIWTPEINDPEFLKNLRIFGRLVDGAIDVHERAVASGRSGSRRRDLPAAEVESCLHAGIMLPDDIP